MTGTSHPFPADRNQEAEAPTDNMNSTTINSQEQFDITKVKREAQTILKYALPNSPEESMAHFLNEEDSSE